MRKKSFFSSFSRKPTFIDEATSAIIDKKNKLIFCWIAKNSCTKFKILFAKIYNPNITYEAELLIHFKKNIYLDTLNTPLEEFHTYFWDRPDWKNVTNETVFFDHRKMFCMS